MNQIIPNGSPASSEPTSAGPIFAPPADILEKGDTVVMLLDIPGADPESLDITLDERILTIMARVTSAEPEDYTPTYIEFRDGTYERRFVFSEQMDGEHINAVLKDGVLRLTVPKAANTVKRINVKAE
ncbi:HSP20 family molecular chaperone IbpA [Rhizobium leguminosarum]|uniref:HSP20 family molecular chaperone IbpA n=1 Tax=Rhizobium leguminosarum TaxID=384 RepID=A0A7Z0DTQ3_RHILE|nr:Hsp20/alpha crystallin family protein [Rhizobium leguminosarum]NYJ09129.1 HSP20 family molecular chaperone IbpA [Rhizobium leguminosarum]